MGGHNLMSKERRIVKKMLNRNPTKRDDFENFLDVSLLLLETIMDQLVLTYQKYVGRSVFPVVPAKVFFSYYGLLVIKK
jgi:hypothetical protein